MCGAREIAFVHGMPLRRQGETGSVVAAATTPVSADAPVSASARGAWWHPVWSASDALHEAGCDGDECFWCDALWARVFARRSGGC